MTHPDELTLLMYADGALSADGVAATAAHLGGCENCRARLEALREEGRLLQAALVAEPEVEVPPFEPPAGAAAWIAGAAVTGLALTLALTVPGLLGALLPDAAARFNPFDAWGVADLAVSGVVFVVQRGDAIMAAILETVVVAAVVLFLGWLASRLRARRPGPLMMTALICIAGGALPQSAEALDLRRSEDGTVLIPAGETIEDTLIVMADHVEIDGDVEGDVIAVGEQVSIRGRVAGMLLTAGETITVEGEVTGSLIAFAQNLTVPASQIGRNLYGFAQNIDAPGGIGQNAIVFAERANLSGSIGRDAIGFAESLEIASTIGGDVTAYAARLTLLAPARISGRVDAHLPDEDDLTVSPSAQIGGATDVHVREEEEEHSEYTSGEFYVFQVLRYVAAFIVGFLLLALVPPLRRVRLQTPMQTVVSGGVGLVTLVATPIIALLVAITIIGLPVAVVGFLLWLVGLYLAKIIVAHVIGARLFDAAGGRHFATTLAVGLAIVIMAINLPFVGGLLNFVATICGLGVLVLFVWHGIRREPATV